MYMRQAGYSFVCLLCNRAKCKFNNNKNNNLQCQQQQKLQTTKVISSVRIAKRGEQRTLHVRVREGQRDAGRQAGRQRDNRVRWHLNSFMNCFRGRHTLSLCLEICLMHLQAVEIRLQTGITMACAKKTA